MNGTNLKIEPNHGLYWVVHGDAICCTIDREKKGERARENRRKNVRQWQ